MDGDETWLAEDDGVERTLLAERSREFIFVDGQFYQKFLITKNIFFLFSALIKACERQKTTLSTASSYSMVRNMIGKYTHNIACGVWQQYLRKENFGKNIRNYRVSMMARNSSSSFAAVPNLITTTAEMEAPTCSIENKFTLEQIEVCYFVYK